MQPESSTQIDPARELISQMLASLEQKIGTQNFQLWFREQATLSCTRERVLVHVTSPFEMTWLQRQFGKHVLTAAREAIGPAAEIEYAVRPDLVDEAKNSDETSTTEQAANKDAEPEPSKPKPDAKPEKPAPARGPSRRLLIDFVAGEESELAFAASLRVCEHPGQRYNPLFIYGDIGIGKTHLLDGIYWETRRRHPGMNVLKMTAETFTNYFTQALSQRKLPEFRYKMRTADVLLIDDVDFLDGKKMIQEEFLHTMKKLEDSGKQMVFTSDRHPRLMLKSREELTSRLGSGMLARISVPSEQTRRAIVERKVKTLGLNLPVEVQHYLAQRFSRTVRELEGALNCLDHYAELVSGRMTLASARRVLADLEQDCRRLIHLSDIERCVCRFFGLQPDELKSKSKSKVVSHPRMLAMYLARKLTQSPYSAIGNYFGGRRHNTAKSAEQTVESWLETESPLQIASREWQLSDVLGTLERELQAC